MEENVNYDLGDSQLRVHEQETRRSELRLEGSNGPNGLISGSDNIFSAEYPKMNDFSVKPDSRIVSCAGSNAAKYKLMSPARLPITRSPCLTIPPGLSPTTLLDSPVLLSNIKVEPSPTTGTFSKLQIMHDRDGSAKFSSATDAPKNAYDEKGSSDFEFKPSIKSIPSSGPSSFGNSASTGLNYKQPDPLVQLQGQYQSHSFAVSSSAKSENSAASSHELTLSVTAPDPPVQLVTPGDGVPPEISSDELQQRQGSNSGFQPSQSDQKGSNPSIVAEKTADDGYNWRKYGQKHVKGSEYPRSYYKCTHPNCQVKKQLERSHDGQITEIIYKGSHDHPKPQPSRRLAAGTILSIQEEKSDRFSSLTNLEDKLSNVHGQTTHHIEPNGTPELSPVTASDDDIEGVVGYSNRIGDDVNDDEDPESKRRKKEIDCVDVTPMGKPIREPRVVVQTLSEVDILDDGYRWRKYGQKVVKGNPNPRSYYKCTNAGCPVRKHVERASHDPKAVITTYEGKHNHDVPAARTSAHDTTGNIDYSTALNGMLSSRLEENDTVSLDLGVGINSSPENRSNEKQQRLDAKPAQIETNVTALGCNKCATKGRDTGEEPMKC
uniref:WRKY domain-containing protein n=1 Tax=Nelumbo nucifera TaxID=4432 RepID=A0A822XJ44_NELNU|nr:TPA_asm: hypothetical protein HUJ06_021740 [Nelumbo nucifera]